MLATIGLDPISGIQRYTFGQLFLWDGIGLVPITIGFYAIPETIELAVLGTSISTQKVEELGGVMEGVKDTFRHWWLVIRCSALGTFTAIIPGMGAATTQWLAYAHAVQSSPNKERFGKGAVEGVLGPGAANNSTLGGSLITTIAFGVPASVIMAILAGRLYHPGHRPRPGHVAPSAQRQARSHFFVRLGHYHLQHYHRGHLLSVFKTARQSHSGARRHHHSDYSSIDLPRRLCGKERLRRHAGGAFLRRPGLGHGKDGVAAAAGPAGSRSRPAGREQAFPIDRQLRNGLAWASRRADHFCRHADRHRLSDHQK